MMAINKQQNIYCSVHNFQFSSNAPRQLRQITGETEVYKHLPSNLERH
jgi:hypothetical protein